MLNYLVLEKPKLDHQNLFDPTYGYDEDELLNVGCPEEPVGFEEFWLTNHKEFKSSYQFFDLQDLKSNFKNYKIYKVFYSVREGYETGAWLLEPEHVKKAMVIGHGYGGRESFNMSLRLEDTAVLLPCAQGFNLSASDKVPNNSARHVLHQIENKSDYILKYCVMELWGAAHYLADRYQTNEIDFSGGSFGGGLGALMLPWESLYKKVHLGVPTFGNHPLRVTLPCNGSGNSITNFYQSKPGVLDNLAYFDASIAAKRCEQESFFSLAVFDPSVPPPGQFSVFNSWKGSKKAYCFHSGHHSSSYSIDEEIALVKLLSIFFS